MMFILADLPPSRACRPRHLAVGRSSRALALLVSCAAGALACGGLGGDVEPLECAGGAGCEPVSCADPGCAPAPRAERVIAGELGCSVVSCPPGTDVCCSSVSASATDSAAHAYVSRMQLVDGAWSELGEVRAEFTFDAPDQQGWVTFELGSELDLARLAIIGRQEGVADRFLSVNTKRDAGGCAFTAQLEPRPGPFGGPGSFVLGDDVAFNSGAFCYGNGRPGRASEVAFAVFSMGPGKATLTISNLALIGDFGG